jgi:hypothetical protein
MLLATASVLIAIMGLPLFGIDMPSWALFRA